MIDKLRDRLSEIRKELSERRDNFAIRMGWKQQKDEIPPEWLTPDITPLDDEVSIETPELAEEPTYKFYEEPDTPSLIKYSTKQKLKQMFVFILFIFSLMSTYGVIQARTLIKEWPALLFHLFSAGAYIDYLRRFRTDKTTSWYLLTDIEKEK